MKIITIVSLIMRRMKITQPFHGIVFGIVLCISIMFISDLQAQNNVGIGTTVPHPSALLELEATNMGILIPRTDTNLITNPATGLLIFQNADTQFYYFDGTWWKQAIGPQGPAGFDGATGAQGPTGPTGNDGADGA